MIRRREKEVIKVLLLGQADSGKSTTLKNFRMKYAKEAWRTERASWRAAILLNVVKALVNILHALSTRPVHSSLETPTADLSPTTEQPPSPSNLTPIDNNPFPTAMSTLQHPPSLASLYQPTSQGIAVEHAELVKRLSEPLVRLERELKMHLGPASEEIGEFGMDEGIRCPTVTSPTSPTLPSSSSSSSYASPNTLSPQPQPHDETNIHLQTPTPCDIPRSPPAQEHLGRRVLGIDTVLDGSGPSSSSASAGISSAGPASSTRPSSSTTLSPGPASSSSAAPSPAQASATTIAAGNTNTTARDLVQKRRFANGFLVRCWPSGPCRAREEEDSPSPIDLTRISSVLAPLVPDMNALWADPSVKELVRRRRVRVEDGVEFLLTDLSRVTSPDYVPTDDDIICCRLRTTGVTEYALTFPTDRKSVV